LEAAYDLGGVCDILGGTVESQKLYERGANWKERSFGARTPVDFADCALSCITASAPGKAGRGKKSLSDSPERDQHVDSLFRWRHYSKRHGGQKESGGVFYHLSTTIHSAHS
jgi:hypothetical protein